MLDLKRIRDEPDAVKAGARKKRIDAGPLVDRIVALDGTRRKLQHERDDLKARQNQAGKEIAKLSGPEKDRLRGEMGASLPA